MPSNSRIVRLIVIALLGGEVVAAPLTLVLGITEKTHAQQQDGQVPPAKDEQVRPARGRGLLAEMTAFKTDVPQRPFDIVLVRPTRDSITASVICYEKDACEGYIEYCRDDSAHMDRCAEQRLPAGDAVLFTLDHLSPDTAYVYRLKYRRISGANVPGSTPVPSSEPEVFSSSEYYKFHTPRRMGETFTFTIQADSHLDQGVEPRLYAQTLTNMLADRPDFVVDLGDTFMTDKRGKDFKTAVAQYDAQRYYFSRVAHSVPLYMVLGNHDGEKGTSGRDPGDIGPWSYLQRTMRFPEPIIDGKMYSGSTGINDGVGSNYYAFEWGDALFVVLDPFWSTSDRIRGGGGGGGGGPPRADREPIKPTDASWSSTLGREQYDWLARTLEGSKAKFRFVFIHHLVGGMGGAESRGGAESSPFFEWGGNSADGTPGFAAHRAGWPMPIHALLVKHKVAAVFHGHDHMYVRAERDGVVYQCVPQPGNPRGNTRSAAEYNYKSGTILGSPGYLRVRVRPDNADVEFVRSVVEAADENRRGDRREAEANGTIVSQYKIAPAKQN